MIQTVPDEEKRGTKKKEGWGGRRDEISEKMKVHSGITNIAKFQQHVLEIPPTLTDPFLLRRTDAKYKRGRWWLRKSGATAGKCIGAIVISFTWAICVRDLAFRLDLSRGANAVWPWWCARSAADGSRRGPGLPPWILCPTAICVRQKIDTFLPSKSIFLSLSVS